MPLAIQKPLFSVRDLKPISVRPDRDFKAVWSLYTKKINNTGNIANGPEDGETAASSQKEEENNDSYWPASASTYEAKTKFSSNCMPLTAQKEENQDQFEDGNEFWNSEPHRLFAIMHLAGTYFALHEFPLRGLFDNFKELVSDDFCQIYDPLNVVHPNVKSAVRNILQESKEELRMPDSLMVQPNENQTTNLALNSMRGYYGYRVFDYLGLSQLNSIVQIVFFTPIFQEWLEKINKHDDFRSHCSELIYTLLKINKEVKYLKFTGNEAKRNPLKKLMSELQEDFETSLKEEGCEIDLKNSCAYWTFLLKHLSKEVNTFNSKVRGSKIANFDQLITTSTCADKDRIMGSPRFLCVNYDRDPDFKSEEINNIIALPHIPGTEKRFYRIIAIICKKGKTETYDAFTHDNINGKWLNIKESFAVEVNESLVLSNAATHGHMMFYEKAEDGPKTIHD